MTDGESPSGSPPLPEAAPAEACSILVTQAKKAFQEHRRKDCLVMTSVILSIDPEHKEAQVIEQWIRADLQKEVNDVRNNILKSGPQPGAEAIHRAERTLRTILVTDPHNEPASHLLQEVRTAANALTAAPKPEIQIPESESEKPPISEDAYPGYTPEGPNWKRLYTALVLALVLPISAFALWKYVANSPNGGDSSVGVLEVIFTGGVQVFVNDEERGTTPLKPLQLAPDVYHLRYIKDGKEVGREDVKITAGVTTRNTIQEPAGKLVLIIVPASGVQLKLDGKPYGAAPESLDVSPGVHQLEFTAAGYTPQSLSAVVSSGGRSMVPVLMKSLTAAAPVDNKAKNLPPPPPSPPVKPANSAPNAPPVAVTTGTIRWNPSLVDVDIYENDRRIGSTPMTQDVQAGPHTFEYRHEGLKKTATYNVQAGSTTNLTVSFEITVNINVTPFADVFLIGDNTVVLLGETPLNRVIVPVGGTLAFRYSTLPEKRYRVTAKDNNGSIHVSFP